MGDDFRLQRPGGTAWSILALILLAFLVLRLPFVCWQPGGQDEQLFAVPGYTILESGIPRIPYYPARNPDSVFYRADDAVFALPPAFFYTQAPFYALLPAGYPTGRLPSLLSAVVAIILVWMLGRRLFRSESTGLWAAGLYSMSRVLYFPAIIARPDMLCATCGLAALWLIWTWRECGQRWRLIAAGLLLGLGLLSHPYAISYCLLCGVWVLVVASGWRQRITSGAILVMSTLIAFAAWLPLVAIYPDVFRHQFFNNVLDPAGPGVVRRLLWPWPLLGHQAGLLWEQAGVWQTGLMFAGLLSATGLLLRRELRTHRCAIGLAWAAVYLLAAFQGSHPTASYWCFPGALLFLCVAFALTTAVTMIRGSRLGRMAVISTGILTGVVMLPGSGIRTWLVYMQHPDEINYRAAPFVERLLAELPAGARYVVDQEYVFDFYLAGYDVTLADLDEQYVMSNDDYDFLVIGRSGLQKGTPDAYRGELVQSFGDRNDRFSCYAGVYRKQTSVPD